MILLVSVRIPLLVITHLYSVDSAETAVCIEVYIYSMLAIEMIPNGLRIWMRYN